VDILPYYRRSKECKLESKINSILENYFAGYERKIADLTQVGEMSLMEGKQPLLFVGYRFIANEAIKQ
jgi:hypothetical protein